MCGERLNGCPEPDFLKDTDIPACKAIWLACFPEDTPDIPESFFHGFVQREEGLVCRMDGKPVSMVFMLPAFMSGEGKCLPIQYIYAAATHPAYQRQGIFAGLLHAALDRARSLGAAASFLRPGEPELTAYYARFGYQPFFAAARRTLRSDKMNKVSDVGSWISVTAGRYTALRRRHLSQRKGLYVDWPERLTEFAVAMAESKGGGAVGDRQGNCALCEPRDGSLYVHELLCPQEQWETVCGELLSFFQCGKAQILSPADVDGEVFGLLCPLSDDAERWINTSQQPYMGFALD